MGLDDAKDHARELFMALKEDTNKLQKISQDIPYTAQLSSGAPLISAGSFEAMNLKPELLKALYSLQIEKPSKIQDLAIPQIMAGRNLAFHSKSGTGKTIAFVLSALNIVESGKGPQVLILTPTRELSVQVGGVIKELCQAVDVSVCLALRNFVSTIVKEELVIGSPGKIGGLIRNNVIQRDNVKLMIFDEADELISQQVFKSHSLFLMKQMPTAQKIFFSATYSEFSQGAIKSLVPDADTFFEQNTKADNIQLFHVEVQPNTKIETLKKLFGYLTIAQTIIFVATRNSVNFLTKKMVDDGFSVSSIHGDMQPVERDTAQEDFLKAKTKILISTDVFSRGMDIPQVNLIINYDLPVYREEVMFETYIHRIGRSGRFNRPGFVVDFLANEDDLRALTELQTKSSTTSKMFTMEGLEEVFKQEDL